jgi:hypothetical protein
MGANLLHRKSTSLSDAQVVLIKMLAEVAVEDFMREIDPDEAVHNNGELHEERA